MEEDESSRQKLINVLARFEKQVEDVVVDIVENPDIQTISGSQQGTSHMPRPIITPTQLGLIDALNKLPNLRKEFAFIHPVGNSHAIIICRDVKRFSIHRKGEGVVRHWAHVFVL